MFRIFNRAEKPSAEFFRTKVTISDLNQSFNNIIARHKEFSTQGENQDTLSMKSQLDKEISRAMTGWFNYALTQNAQTVIICIGSHAKKTRQIPRFVFNHSQETFAILNIDNKFNKENASFEDVNINYSCAFLQADLTDNHLHTLDWERIKEGIAGFIESGKRVVLIALANPIYNNNIDLVIKSHRQRLGSSFSCVLEYPSRENEHVVMLTGGNDAILTEYLRQRNAGQTGHKLLAGLTLERFDELTLDKLFYRPKNRSRCVVS